MNPVTGLPTDSLYKFMAIAGTVLTALPFIQSDLDLAINAELISLQYEMERMIDAGTRYEEYVAAMEEHERKRREFADIIAREMINHGSAAGLSLEGLTAAILVGDELVERYLNDFPIPTLDGQDIVEAARESLAGLNDAIDVARERGELLEETHRLVGERIDIVNLRIERHERRTVLLSVVGVVGLNTAIAGFIMWYNRLQKYVDMSTKRAAERVSRRQRRTKFR